MTTTEQLDLAHRTSLWTPFLRMETVLEHGPVVFDHAEGVYVWDVSGKRYLDAHASLWLMNVGFGRQEIVDAACSQMRQLPFFSMFQGYSNPPAIALAERLLQLTAPEGMGRVFYSDSGSEAVETAFKIARQYWKNRGQAAKYKFIARRNAYHGVTFGAMSATGMTANRRMFEPLVPGFRHISDPNCYRNDFGGNLSEDEVAVAASEALRRQILFEGPETVAAFIAEPVQGAGGVVVPPAGYLQRCREICREYDVLFIADEVITGFGRTGTWFGSRTYGIQPDIMCFAKGLTSGYVPMSATLCRPEIFEAFLGPATGRTELRHGNTYSGHATAAAAALANLAIIERENLPENARVVGQYFLERLRTLERHAIVGDVRGIGLLARVELVADRATKAQFSPLGSVGARVQRRAQELGVIIRPVLDILTFSPPLILTRDQADEIVAVIDQAIGDVTAELDSASGG
ncbi:MAG TPA: aspartate aminotransferase family protein [Gemmatimonadales bacterium]|nr:aspartate aminotransferase family protein [Gemmatimonadales bacterium]